MEARIVGFEMVPKASAVTISHLLDHLGTKKNVRVGPYQRIVYAHDAGDYYRGLILTIKNQRKFLELRKDGGGVKIVPRQLEADALPVDFNLFVVNKATGVGVYLQYHGSCSVHTFGVLCEVEYRNLSRARRDAAIDALAQKTGKQAKSVREAHRGGMKVIMVVRKEQLDELLERYKVMAFSFDVSVVSVSDPDYAPLKQFAKRHTTRVRFGRDSPFAPLINFINAKSQSPDVSDGKVECIDEDGITRTFRLAQNPDTFGSFKFDDIADTITIDNFHEASLFDAMMKAMSDNRAVFSKPPLASAQP